MGKPGSGNWNQRLMLKTADLLILPRIFANLREELKNWLMLLMRTERIMNACKDWLINFKPRSKLTRSKLKRRKKLLLSIWPSSAKLKDILVMLKSGLTLMHKPLLRLRQRDAGSSVPM